MFLECAAKHLTERGCMSTNSKHTKMYVLYWIDVWILGFIPFWKQIWQSRPRKFYAWFVISKAIWKKCGWISMTSRSETRQGFFHRVVWSLKPVNWQFNICSVLASSRTMTCIEPQRMLKTLCHMAKPCSNSNLKMWVCFVSSFAARLLSAKI